MTAYYNEIDPYAAEWLRNLIAAGHIAHVAATGVRLAARLAAPANGASTNFADLLSVDPLASKKERPIRRLQFGKEIIFTGAMVVRQRVRRVAPLVDCKDSQETSLDSLDRARCDCVALVVLGGRGLHDISGDQTTTLAWKTWIRLNRHEITMIGATRSQLTVRGAS